MSKSEDSSPVSKMVSSTKMMSSNGSSCDNDNSSASSKLSKIGRRIRESCRQLQRGKHPSGGASNNPEDYGSTPMAQESGRSLHYVPMDFSGGKQGRIVTAKDLPGLPTKEGYTYFRRNLEPQNVDHLLTETQANIHKHQAWFHKGVGRDLSQRILGSHCVDGLFLVRESSVQGGFVISYYFNGRAYHAPVMPSTNPTTSAVTYSLDEGKTKFFDLLQLVEFYQLNKGSLLTKLSHYVICSCQKDVSSQQRSESPTESNSSCKHASDVSLDSSKVASDHQNSKITDDNHNSKGSSRAKTSMETSSEEDDKSVNCAAIHACDTNMASSEEEEEG